MFQVSGAACVQGRRQSAWAWCLRGTVSGLIGAARGGGTALSCAPRVSGQEAGAWSYESLLGAMEGSLARCTPGSGFTQQPALCQDLRKTWQAWQASWASLGVRLRTASQQVPMETWVWVYYISGAPGSRGGPSGLTPAWLTTHTSGPGGYRIS